MRNESENNYFLLNEPFSSLHPVRVLNYFKDAKLIIIHRDPRDSYCNLISETSDFMPKKVEHYIELFKNMIDKVNCENTDSKRILNLKFEDLVFEHEVESIVFENNFILNIDSEN